MKSSSDIIEMIKGIYIYLTMAERFEILQLFFGRRQLLRVDAYVLLWFSSQARGKLSHHLSNAIEKLNILLP